MSATRQAMLRQMRKAVALARRRVQTTRTAIVQAPVTGLNMRDPVEMVGRTEATVFNNMQADVDGVRPIKGPTFYASISASVDAGTLMTHRAADGTETFFAVAGGKIWDISSGGSVTTPTSVTGLSSDYLSWTNVNDKLIWCNGVDAPQHFDGTSWSVEPLSVASGEPALSLDKLGLVYPFKNRVYYAERDKLGFWYTTLDSTFDGLRYFDLSYVARKGGALLTITRYTVDGGGGPDDYPVFVTTKGEAIVYQGTNPNAAGSWSFVGTYQLPPSPVLGTSPQSHQIAAEVGAQTMLITNNDYVALPSALVKGGVVEPSKLNGALARTSGTVDGWGAMFFDAGDLVVFNVPKATASGATPRSAEQHVVNAQNGTAAIWGVHVGALSWAEYNNELYYLINPGGAGAGSNTVNKALAENQFLSVELESGTFRLGTNSNKMVRRARVVLSATASAEAMSTSATFRLRYNGDLDATSTNITRNEWMLQSGAGTFIQYQIKGQLDSSTRLKYVEFMHEPAAATVFGRE